MSLLENIATSIITSAIVGIISYWYSAWRKSINDRTTSLLNIRSTIQYNLAVLHEANIEQLPRLIQLPPAYESYGYVLLDDDTHNKRYAYIHSVIRFQARNPTDKTAKELLTVTENYYNDINGLLTFWNDFLGKYCGILYFILPKIFNYIQERYLNKHTKVTKTEPPITTNKS